MKTNMFSALMQVKNKLFEARPGVDPTRQKVMVVLVPALAIVLIVALFYVLNDGPGSAAAGETEQSLANTNAGGIKWEIPEPYPMTLRDPMQIASLSTTQTEEQKPQTGQIVVKSILYSQGNPSAVVGSEIVHQGDIVLGATVVKIDENTVEFEKDGKRWTQEVLR